jgi:hypothetical protein
VSRLENQSLRAKLAGEKLQDREGEPRLGQR